MTEQRNAVAYRRRALAEPAALVVRLQRGDEAALRTEPLTDVLRVVCLAAAAHCTVADGVIRIDGT